MSEHIGPKKTGPKKTVVTKRKRISKKGVRRRSEEEKENSDNPLLSQAPSSSIGAKLVARNNRIAAAQNEHYEKIRKSHGMIEERDLRAQARKQEQNEPNWVRRVTNRFR